MPKSKSSSSVALAVPAPVVEVQVMSPVVEMEVDAVPKPVKTGKNLLSATDFKSTLESIVKEIRLSNKTSLNLGKSGGTSVMVGDQEVKFRDLKSLQEKINKRILNLNRNHEAALKYHPKRKNRKSTNGNLPFKSLSRYEDSIVSFFEEAAASHEKLSVIKDLAFISNPEMRCITSPNMMTQLFTIYIMVMDLQNPDHRQMIKPDALMLKYFSEEIQKTLVKQQAQEKNRGPIYDSNDKKKIIGFDADRADSARFPGYIRFPYIQVMSTLLLKDSKKESEETQLFLSDEKNKSIINSEIDKMKRFREMLIKERDSNPNTARIVNKKSVSNAKKSEEQREKLERVQARMTGEGFDVVEAASTV